MTALSWAAAWAVAGLAAGMLVNLAADLLPDRKPLRTALSCPSCGRHRPQVRWPAWWGMWAAVQCPTCGRRLAWRAVLVELAMGGLWAFAGVRFGPSPQLWLFGAQTFVFALVFVIDLEHKLVLNRVVLGGTAVALAGSLFWGSPPWRGALLGGAVGFALFLLIALAKPGGMGMGDVKLAGLIGLMIGYPGVLTALFVGIIAGGIGAAALLVSRRVQRGGYLPYGPFLVTGALIGLLQAVPC